MTQPLTKSQETWLQTLEFGGYQQGRTYLKQRNSGGTQYCCLGVWAEISGAEVTEETNGICWFDGADTYLTTSLYMNLGLRGEEGPLKKSWKDVYHWQKLMMKG